MKVCSKGQASNKLRSNDFWHRLWKLSVPNATKMLLWRASHESLPTNQNLNKRRIRESALCPICIRESESTTHALWSCPSTQDAWGVSSRKLQKDSVVESPFSSIVGHMLSVLDENDMSTFASIAHQLWKRRNQYVFEGKYEAPETVVNTATKIVLDYKEANNTQVSKDKPIASSVQSWSAPPLHVFKANWDASVDKVQCKVGIGVVIRDWNGCVVATLRSQKDMFLDPLLAESFSVLKAVILCNQLNMQDVIFEGGSLNVVQ
ncbi:uncharacterized protein LOC122310263 [Carya illinoinensis]|uniref:uncharacterized protein LOC122310263 n=1 Tax=Carya illinoinensis TaxID=32201 RepID=UPI001C722F76|nr:uncharacterized protein LOC122310263 [Carya illinoinensis]